MGTAIKIAPSILAADFARLGQAVAEAEAAGADYIHVDVMDGHFVPNITLGPLVVQALRRATSLPLDVHLMIEAPERYLAAFAQAGANHLTVHAETCPHLHRTLQQIHALGCRAGVALNPSTPPVAVSEIVNDADLILVMTVNPGFGGQTFIAGMLDKVQRVRALLDEHGSAAELEVDGGIDPETAPYVVAAGARVLVAGSAVFHTRESIAEAVAAIRRAAETKRPAAPLRAGLGVVEYGA